VLNGVFDNMFTVGDGNTMPDARCKMQDAGCWMQDASFRMQDANNSKREGRVRGKLWRSFREN